MKKLHLDSMYRDRWEEFYLANGTVEDSRVKNWREVKWNRVIKVVVHILNYSYSINCNHDAFKFFLNFRWAGQEAQYKNGIINGYKKINLWTIGWTNGINCFLTDIDFYTGNIVNQYVKPLTEFKYHIHPLCKGMV